MISVLSDEDSKVARMKQKLINDVHVKEETRSFLSFFRENLNISQSDLEQGFNKHRFRPNRNTILSVTALLIALLCLGLESWRFHCSLVNAREIEELKRSVESLKHRFLEEDLLDELKAFEEQVVILFLFFFFFLFLVSKWSTRKVERHVPVELLTLATVCNSIVPLLSFGLLSDCYYYCYWKLTTRRIRFNAKKLQL